MITDRETNFLYLADTLPHKFPVFHSQLSTSLNALNIPHSLLPETADVWARDYMPVQVTENKLVSFVYKPDYLQEEKYIHLQTQPEQVLSLLSIPYHKASIKLDGGNVVCSRNKVILTEKIFEENHTLERSQLIAQLEALFETDQLYFVPRQSYDYLGHSDGMLRFLDEDTLLLNDYSRESKTFQKKLQKSLSGFSLEILPYNVYQNKDTANASGTYINFLHMKQGIILPAFNNIAEDEKAYSRIEELFPGECIEILGCSELASHGGVLNCISWSILSR